MTNALRSAYSRLPYPSSRLRLHLLLGAVLYTSVCSTWALTLTWDPQATGPATGVGSDGGGNWQGANGIADFYNGTADVPYTVSSTTAVFGSGGTPGTVLINGLRNGATLRLTALAPGVTNGYVFSSAAGATAAISINNLTLLAGTSSTPVTTTFNVPYALSTINFNSQNNTVVFTGGSAAGNLNQFGTGTASIAGNNANDGASGTVLLTAGTYALGTQIAIGTASTGGGSFGMQVAAGATLNATGDLGVGGYATATSGTSYTGVLTLNGGTATTASGTIYIGNFTGFPASQITAQQNAAGRIIVNSGSLTGANSLVVGNAFSATTAGTRQTAELDVNGGVVYLSNAAYNAGTVLLNNANTASAASTAAVNITGGVVTTGLVSGVILNAGGSTAGSSTLNVSGGSLFLGGTGITNAGGAGSNYSVNFSGGTIATASDWNSNVAMNLSNANGGVTFQTSNLGSATSANTFVTAANATGSNITLNGVLSGNGGLTKTGSGILLLGATNTYTGSTAVNTGTLLLTSNGSINNSGGINLGQRRHAQPAKQQLAQRRFDAVDNGWCERGAQFWRR